MNKEQSQSPLVAQAAQIIQTNQADSTQLVQQWLNEG
jgi:ubiquitin-protein ligase